MPRQLEGQCGLRCDVLQWFSSYLSGRTFQVVYGESTSSVACIPCSVRHSSVVGPRVFTLRILKITSWNMASLFTRLYTYSVVTTTRRLPFCDVRTASRKSAAGCHCQPSQVDPASDGVALRPGHVTVRAKLFNGICSAELHAVYDEMLHPDLRHCSSAASAVCQLSPGVRTRSPVFDVRRSGPLCG